MSPVKLPLLRGSSVRVAWSKCNVKVVADDTAINNLWRLTDTPDRDTYFPTNLMYSECF